jgi:hypothetical protein
MDKVVVHVVVAGESGHSESRAGLKENFFCEFGAEDVAAGVGAGGDFHDLRVDAFGTGKGVNERWFTRT